MIARRPLAERFEARVDRSGGPDACHLWTGGGEADGYGKINSGGMRGPILRTHRVAFALAHGIDPMDLPASVHVCHTCDTPPCCNPRHLYDGDAQTNAADRLSRGRTMKGRHPMRTLDHGATSELVRFRKAGLTIAELARHYGVGETTVRRVLAGTHWASS